MKDELKEFTDKGKPRCQYPRVAGPGGWHCHQCFAGGKYKEGGKTYCKIHLPFNVQAEQDAKATKFDNEWAVEKAKGERTALMEKFCQGVSNENLESLPQAPVLIDAWLRTQAKGGWT